MEATISQILVNDWQLTQIAPLEETHSSWLWRVVTPSGPAVLKLIKPHATSELPGAEALRYWHGLGAARLMAASGHAVLLEWLEGPSLGDLTRAERDDEATQALAGVMRMLHRPRNFAPEGLTPLSDWLEPLTHGTHHGWPRHSGGDMLMAKGLARRLLASATSQIPLHGDLHHDNILWSGSEWKAIDPKGLIGDPAFDAAQSFRNPTGAELLTRRYERIAHLANIYAAELGYSPARLLGWAAVQCAISLIWTREVGKDCTDDLALLPRLLAAYGTVPEPV